MAIATQGVTGYQIYNISDEIFTKDVAFKINDSNSAPTMEDVSVAGVFLRIRTGGDMVFWNGTSWLILNKANILTDANSYSDTVGTNTLASANAYTNAQVVAVTGAAFGGSVVPTSNPAPSVDTFYFATQPGTYTNMGGVVVSANSFAVIAYKLSTTSWTISQTALDLSIYATKEELGLTYKQLLEPDINTCTSNSGGSIRTFIYSVPIEANSVIKELKIYAAVAGTMRIGEFFISGGNVNLVRSVDVVLTVGINTITGFTCAVGNYVGVQYNNTSLLSRIGFNLTPPPTAYGLYSYTTLVSTTPVALSTLLTNQRHGISLLTEKTTTLNYKVNTNASNITSLDSQLDSLAGKTGFGFDYILESNIAAANLTSSAIRTYLFNTPMPVNKVINKIYFKAFTAGNIYLAEFSISGGSATRVQGISVNVTTGINEIEGFTCTAGNYIGIIQTTTDFLGRIAVAGGSPQGYGAYIFTSSVNTTPVALPSLTTNSIFGINVELAEPNNLQLRVKNLEEETENINTELENVRPLTDIYHIFCFGQSLSIGTDGGASTYTAPLSIAYNISLINDNVQDMNGGYIEMFKTLADEFKPLPSTFKIVTSLGGAGGKSILQLSKGTTYYNTVLSNIVTARNNALTAGLTYNVPAFVWTQGEEDYRCAGVPSNYGSGIWNPFDYSTKLIQLVNDFNTDIKAITGQTNDVKCIMYQTASHNTYYRYPRIALEQLDAALNDRRIVLAKTMYDVEYNIADYVHAPNKTYRNIGNYYGIALYKTIMNNEHPLPIHPASNYIIGNDIYIRFHVPEPPLVLDTSLVDALPDGKYGFNLYTVTNETNGTSGTIALATETINSVTIYNPNTIKLSLSAIPPSGTRLTYGINGDGSLDIDGTGTGGKSGRFLGARGNLRDSRTYLNKVDNYFQLYNWCPIFEIVL